ncbi:hypothetical protein V3Q90_12405 [Flavobacterium oreochromis]|uniref:hypothetical protein n=1 Tax=Flavobacterium oreochromis TaxID=2906078 RepID=UPI000CDA84FB|nr:hypothetical protein BWK58_06465 [Flavobacterium columnare]
MKTHTLICAIIALLALNIDVDPEKIKPPRGGRTLYIERDKGGGRPLAFKDRGNTPPQHKV